MDGQTDSVNTLKLFLSYENIILMTFGKKKFELTYKSKGSQGREVKQDNGSSSGLTGK